MCHDLSTCSFETTNNKRSNRIIGGMPADTPADTPCQENITDNGARARHNNNNTSLFSEELHMIPSSQTQQT